jgi:hypothetical protein
VAALRLALAALLVAAGAAQAQFKSLPAPAAVPAVLSEAETEEAYRADAARHLYNVYAKRILKGKLPPFIHGVMIVEARIDAEGGVRELNVVREPAAAEVRPWVLAMMRAAAPFPVPAKLPEGVRYVDIWLVDKGGRFQLDTLTEGQRLPK